MAIPFSLEDARRQIHLAEDDESQDSDLRDFIVDAAAWVERYTGHILVARDVTQSFRGFGPVELRAWPIAPTAAVGVAYNDAAGQPIALTGARLDVSSRPARVLPAGCFWPFHTTDQLFTVTIRAGYEPDDVVPGNIRRAMLILISAYDSDREGGAIFQQAEVSARSLCRDYRLLRV
ncbi:head-tail connector protein [Sphingomonas sp. PB4P5]|uniref:head-tail connector protein n=1 Tax=Parasphingomonas puruogangriensis TaxID=3096155 RepID=UPI002FC9F609